MIDKNNVNIENLFTWVEYKENGEFKVRDDLVSEIRTDLSKNTKSIGKTSRVGSTLILNDPLGIRNDPEIQKTDLRQDHNAADIAEYEFDGFLKKIKNEKSLSKKVKNEIKTVIKAAKETNRLLEDAAAINFLQVAIQGEILKLKKLTNHLSHEAVANQLLKKYESLDLTQIQTTNEALVLHENSTKLRKALEKVAKDKAREEDKKSPSEEEKKELEKERQQRLHDIKQLDILMKRYVDIRYKYPVPTHWEKLAGKFSITNLIISNLAIVGMIGTGIAGFFTGGTTWPITAWLSKAVFTGLAPVIVELVNLGRNLKHGRFLIDHANMFSAMLFGASALMFSFKMLAMPLLIKQQMHLVHEGGRLAHPGPKLEVGGEENSINVGMFGGQAYLIGATIKTMKKSNAVTMQLFSIINYKSLGDYKKTNKKSHKAKYSNFYVISNNVTPENPTLELINSKRDKIANTQIGLRGTFGLFLSKEEWEVRRLKNMYRALSDNDDLATHKEGLDKIIAEIDKVKKIKNEKGKQLGNTLTKLHERAKKELKRLGNDDKIKISIHMILNR